MRKGAGTSASARPASGSSSRCRLAAGVDSARTAGSAVLGHQREQQLHAQQLQLDGQMCVLTVLMQAAVSLQRASRLLLALRSDGAVRVPLQLGNLRSMLA
jgi:hypothetical protein